MFVLEEEKKNFVFENDSVKVKLGKNDFAIQEVSLKSDTEEGSISLKEAANMYVILQGMKKLTFAP